jgi:hypothetical protein
MGNIVASSAKVKAMNIIKVPPKIHHRTAAGPAACATYSGPNNHPDPTMLPTEIMRSANVEIERCKFIFILDNVVILSS